MYIKDETVRFLQTDHGLHDIKKISNTCTCSRHITSIDNLL